MNHALQRRALDGEHEVESLMMDSIRTITAWLSSRASLRSERGATALEYAIMASFIAAVIVISVAFLGSATNNNFECTGASYASRSAQC